MRDGVRYDRFRCECQRLTVKRLANVKAGLTAKHPSDVDEIVTQKYPSDDDEQPPAA